MNARFNAIVAGLLLAGVPGASLADEPASDKAAPEALSLGVVANLSEGRSPAPSHAQTPPPAGVAASVAPAEPRGSESRAASADRANLDANKVAQINIIGGGRPDSAGGGAGESLDMDSLGDLLRGLDMHELEVLKTDSGTKLYLCKHKRRGWTTVQIVEVSRNGQYVWHSSNLAKFDSVNSIPRAKLVRIMGMHGSFGPIYFELNTKTGMLSVTQAIPNTGITPERMQEQLIAISDVIIDTSDEWQAQD